MSTSMQHPDIIARIEGLFLGEVKELWPGRPPSAIAKMRVLSPQEIAVTGFVGDSQADLNHHGGEDKAIHHYPADHYSDWRAEGEIRRGTIPAAFGENISTSGITEGSLCIGDILRLGSATIQVSQGRQPCWKLGCHTGNKRMPVAFAKTGRTGWYYRVLEVGRVAEGDDLRLIERRHPQWSIQRVTLARLNSDASREEAEILADMADLAETWRTAFARMASG